MNRTIIAFLAICIQSSIAFPDLIFDDGVYHLIDYEVTEVVRLDPMAPVAGTHVELADECASRGVLRTIDKYKDTGKVSNCVFLKKLSRFKSF